jgi:nitrogen fixation/metabolism regulation signal transduction histidine kinase
MRKRYIFASALSLAILVTLIFWQVSFSFGTFGPANPVETIVFWAISTVVFVLAVTLGFMLFRTGVNLYFARQQNREGSRIQTKLVLGALALSLLPVIFLVAFSYQILNRNLRRWFMQPVEGIKIELTDAGVAYGNEVQERADALAKWLAVSPEIQNKETKWAQVCLDNRIEELRIETAPGTGTDLCKATSNEAAYSAETKVAGVGTLIVRVQPPAKIEEKQKLIDRFLLDYDTLLRDQEHVRSLYLQFILLIALFILFVSTWIALKLARQLSGPIAALVDAARQVREGNLGHRVTTPATDELVSLVRGFNEMTSELESNSKELESRRRFTEAILESIPTGVVSLTAEGRIQRVNRASRNLFTEEQLEHATTLSDLLPAEQPVSWIWNGRGRCCIWASRFQRCRRPSRELLAMSWCWKIPATCCARRRPRRGMRSRAASRMN